MYVSIFGKKYGSLSPKRTFFAAILIWLHGNQQQHHRLPGEGRVHDVSPDAGVEEGVHSVQVARGDALEQVVRERLKSIPQLNHTN